MLLPQLCPTNSTTEASAQGLDYIFTMIVYSMLYIGRFIEALVVHIHIYKYFFQSSLDQARKFREKCRDGLKRKKWVMVGFVFLSLYMLAHSLSVPALGIVLETRRAHCREYIHEYYTIHWVLEVVRCLYDVGVRLLMILATMAIGVLWIESPLQREDRDEEREPKNFTEYLRDHEVTNKHHRAQSKDYIRRGREVEPILEIFQTWFAMPWMLFYTSSYVETDYILRSWKNRPSVSGEIDFSEVVYMVHNFNQMVLLFIPYLCAKKMNTYHDSYLSLWREDQVNRYKSASRMALASLNKVEKESHYTFTPRVWGSSIKIEVDNPLYVVTLLITIFFTVFEGLI